MNSSDNHSQDLIILGFDYAEIMIQHWKFVVSMVREALSILVELLFFFP